MKNTQLVRMISLIVGIGFSASGMALNVFNNKYYLELSAGSKAIIPSSETETLTAARVGKVGFFSHFTQNLGLGLTVAMVEFANPESPIGSSTDRGTEVGLEGRLLTPALNFLDTNLRAFLAIGGTVESSNKRRTMTAAGDESLTLTGQSESTEIQERFRSLGPIAAVGLKWDVAEKFGVQAEYGIGREKWISESATFNGKEKSYDKLQEGLRTSQLVFGISLIN